MQAAGTVPRGALDLRELAPIFDRPGPFATVYLGTDPHIDNAEQRSLQRWRSVRDELTAAGAPAPCLDAIEELVGLDDLWGPFFAPRRAFAGLPADSASVALCHNPDAVERLMEQLRRGPVTLVYGAKDSEHSHALALKQYLERVSKKHS